MKIYLVKGNGCLGDIGEPYFTPLVYVETRREEAEKHVTALMSEAREYGKMCSGQGCAFEEIVRYVNGYIASYTARVEYNLAESSQYEMFLYSPKVAAAGLVEEHLDVKVSINPDVDTFLINGNIIRQCVVRATVEEVNIED